MKEDEKGNIFDMAGKQKARPTAKIPPEKIPEKETKPAEPVGNVDEMFEKMRSMKRELQDNLEKTLTQSGLSPKELENVVQPFKGTEAWKKSEKEHQNLVKKVSEAIGSSAPGPKTEKEKEESKMDKERKGKTLGLRKKWMPMR